MTLATELRITEPEATVAPAALEVDGVSVTFPTKSPRDRRGA